MSSVHTSSQPLTYLSVVWSFSAGIESLCYRPVGSWWEPLLTSRFTSSVTPAGSVVALCSASDIGSLWNEEKMHNDNWLQVHSLLLIYDKVQFSTPLSGGGSDFHASCTVPCVCQSSWVTEGYAPAHDCTQGTHLSGDGRMDSLGLVDQAVLTETVATTKTVCSVRRPVGSIWGTHIVGMWKIPWQMLHSIVLTTCSL